eukprot:3208356-Prymnesium_polylepis.1
MRATRRDRLQIASRGFVTRSVQPGGGAIFSSRAAANINAIGSVSGVPVGDPRAIVAVEQPACASARTPK